MTQLAEEKIEILLLHFFVERRDQFQVMETNQFKSHRLGNAQVAANVIGKESPPSDSVSGQRPITITIHTGQLQHVEVFPKRGVWEITRAKANRGNANRDLPT